MTIIIAFLLIDLIILYLWEKRRKKNGKTLAWYWGFVSPTLIILAPLALIVGLLVGSGIADRILPLNENRTISEMEEIRNALFKYKDEKSVLPSSLDVLIGNYPLRQEWKKDKWGNDYLYERDKLISAGKDKTLGTGDDIIILLDK